MTHGSLFSGIGGFDLAAEWMGWKNVFHCEWNTFGQRILKHYWPNAKSYHDITKTNFTIHRGQIDILTGGFPCQPFSTAGKRKGTDDARYLWPEMLRVIREVQPTWIIGENVYGLVNWDGGLVFDTVCADLENEGFEVWPIVLPAASVNAPHRRDRVWFVAYGNNSRANESMRTDREWSEIDKGWQGQPQLESRENGSDGDATNTESIGQKYALENREMERGRFRQSDKRNFWDSFPSVSPICYGDDGISSRLDSITFPKWRNETIKGGGNAIVPQVAFQIFKAIEGMYLHEHMERSTTATQTTRP